MPEDFSIKGANSATPASGISSNKKTDNSTAKTTNTSSAKKSSGEEAYVDTTKLTDDAKAATSKQSVWQKLKPFASSFLQKIGKAIKNTLANVTNTLSGNNGKVNNTSKTTTNALSASDKEIANKINSDSRFKGGRFEGQGDLIVSIANKYGINPYLLIGIMSLETGWGKSKAVNNYNNPGGMMDPKSNYMKLKSYSSLQEGIEAVAKNLKNNYIDKGLTTIASIGNKYCPVGAANDPNGTNSGWIPGVTKIINSLSGKQITSSTNIA